MRTDKEKLTFIDPHTKTFITPLSIDKQDILRRLSVTIPL